MNQLPPLTDPLTILVVKFLHMLNLQSPLDPQSNGYRLYTKERNICFEQIKRLLHSTNSGKQTYHFDGLITDIMIDYLNYANEYTKDRSWNLIRLLLAYDMPNEDAHFSPVNKELAQAELGRHVSFLDTPWTMVPTKGSLGFLESMIPVLLLRTNTRKNAWISLEANWTELEKLRNPEQTRFVIPLLITSLNRVCPYKTIKVCSEELVTRLPDHQRRELWYQWFFIAQKHFLGTKKELVMKKFRTDVLAGVAESTMGSNLLQSLKRTSLFDVHISYP
jgi:hypothetical protein